MACCNCAGKLQASLPTNDRGMFVRGLMCGLGGALLGLILYAAIGILLGAVVGYMSFGVGYLVAKAIMMGTKGAGGKRYQIAAAVLTYAAVSMAAIPIGYGLYLKEHSSELHSQALQKQQSSPQTGEQPPAGAPEQPAAKEQDSSSDAIAPAGAPKLGLGTILGRLAVLGLASPFFELENGLSGVIGIVILFVGIQIAWRMTKGKHVTIYGPFETASRAQP
ncbi:MAG TPA: hypothetical protein VJ723_00515 [Candidatus Angelobacter sp.]|nr:hypothetical protein [Candidatus Angelobacter sp.]